MSRILSMSILFTLLYIVIAYEYRDISGKTMYWVQASVEFGDLDEPYNFTGGIYWDMINHERLAGFGWFNFTIKNGLLYSAKLGSHSHSFIRNIEPSLNVSFDSNDAIAGETAIKINAIRFHEYRTLNGSRLNGSITRWFVGLDKIKHGGDFGAIIVYPEKKAFVQIFQQFRGIDGKIIDHPAYGIKTTNAGSGSESRITITLGTMVTVVIGSLLIKFLKLN